MENEQRKYWFFGSKLNTVLLLILIILMVIALKWMYEDKQKYFSLKKSSIEQISDNSFIVRGVVTDINTGCYVDTGYCGLEINKKYNIEVADYTRGRPSKYTERGPVDLSSFDIGNRVVAFVAKSDGDYFTTGGSKEYYVRHTYYQKILNVFNNK